VDNVGESLFGVDLGGFGLESPKGVLGFFQSSVAS